MLSKSDEANTTTAERWDISLGNVGHHDATNKEQEEKKDKEIERTSVGREEEETTGEVSKAQETMDPPLMHER
jgi:hypothetical protein